MILAALTFGAIGALANVFWQAAHVVRGEQKRVYLYAVVFAGAVCAILAYLFKFDPFGVSGGTP